MNLLDPEKSLFPGVAGDRKQIVGEVPCVCWTCLSEVKTEFSGGLPITAFVFIVCDKCGNKRCPRATHHDNPCTNSNATGQKGSRY